MKTYNVTVTRDGRWWMVAVPELDGLTQARRLGEIETMAREWIALATDQELDDVAVNIESIEVGEKDFSSKQRELDALRAKVEALNTQLSQLTREVAVTLTELEVPVRDIGEVLKVSPQRVSQLTESVAKAYANKGDAIAAAYKQADHDSPKGRVVSKASSGNHKNGPIGERDSKRIKG